MLMTCLSPIPLIESKNLSAVSLSSKNLISFNGRSGSSPFPVSLCCSSYSCRTAAMVRRLIQLAVL